MKTTTTIYDIIQSELINMGLNEFYEKNRMTYTDHKAQFIQKTMRYDSDIQKVAEKMFFKGVALKDPEHDLHFKKSFINRFLNRQIAFQTVEAFSSQVIYTFMTNEDFLNMYYESIDDFITGKQTSKGTNQGNDINDFRQAVSTLPQNEVNVDVNDTILDYADDNTINRARNIRDNQTESTSNRYDIGVLLKSRQILQLVMNDFDKKCFLLIW